MAETRKCPYCAEEIRAEAIRCPHCRSRVATSDRDRWYRDHPERRIAGVAAAVAHAFALPIMGVRLGFVVLTFVHLLGPIIYWHVFLRRTSENPKGLAEGVVEAVWRAFGLKQVLSKGSVRAR